MKTKKRNLFYVSDNKLGMITVLHRQIIEPNKSCADFYYL